MDSEGKKSDPRSLGGIRRPWCGNRRGVSLIAAVFVILILSFLGWVLAGTSIIAERESVRELFSARAHYAAAGAGEVMVVLIDRGQVSGDGTAVVEIGSGRVAVSREEESPGFWRVAAVATCGNAGAPERARRRLEVTFQK
ncbi:MAG: hypothetical protein JW781_06740 [Deltaproteobacteria bacterium]|nr:hypothetical protein [Candidatus Anaeroferrophillacea bacterium]